MLEHGVRECKRNKNHHKRGGQERGCQWLYLEINITYTSPFPGNSRKMGNFSDNPSKCRNARAFGC